MVDYSRWDKLDDDEADATEVYAARLSSHNESMSVIASWLKEANPDLPDEQVTGMLRFIATQHRGTQKNNVPRAQEIIALQKSRPLPPMLPLLHLFDRARELSTEDAPAEERPKATRIANVALSAINTLYACQHYEGGAEALFDAVRRDPDGPIANKYVGMGFAKECLDSGCPEVAAPPNESWIRKLGKALLWQSLLSLFTMAALQIAMRYSLFPGLMGGVPEPAVAPVEPMQASLVGDAWSEEDFAPSSNSGMGA
uniref:Uncharacterized protein n=1 Tax=Coccolithus braarudii TaxID=221442 RepID=A0A7S0L7X0_9EUKA